MIPHERSLVKKLAGRPFALIGVNSDADKDELRKHLTEEQITWRSFWNGPKGPRGPIAEAWNVHGWPTIYILDADGTIRARDLRDEELEAKVLELVEMAEKKTPR